MPYDDKPYSLTFDQKLGKFIVGFGSYGPKLSKLALNGQNFAIPFQKKILTKNFLVVTEVVWRPNFVQKIRKKYRMVKAVGPELTHVRTHVPTRVNL